MSFNNNTKDETTTLLLSLVYGVNAKMKKCVRLNTRINFWTVRQVFDTKKKQFFFTSKGEIFF